MTFIRILVDSLNLVLCGGMLAFYLMRGDVASSVIVAVATTLAVLVNIVSLMD